jgi:hypothetical protein
MSEEFILNKPRLPVMYDLTDEMKITNPFHERFGKFENPYDEFIDICYKNLTFAVFNIMKWKDGPLELAPFQSVILRTLWDKTFPILLMTRGGGKTFMLAVYCLLRAIMIPGSKIVIVAASFRQSKLVFDYIEQIYNYSPIVQAAVTKVSRPNDAREMMIGTSTIKALPLGNGEKIRGVRATDIVCDEYASIPEEIFQVVVRGFAAVAADPIEQARQIHLENQLVKSGAIQDGDRKKLQSNKIIYSGTAHYQFNHYYRLYSIHKAIIDNEFVGSAEDINESFSSSEDGSYKLEGNLDYRDYAIIQVPYMALPEGFMDDKQIIQARATMPRALFAMEYECMFATDSDGFFKRLLINEATPGRGDEKKSFSVELIGDPHFEYVMGIDPARKTDNFSISILKLMKNGKGYRNVYCYSMNNKNWVTSVRKIRELLGKFNIVRIAVDSGGGGLTVEDLLQNAEILRAGEQPIWRYDDEEHMKFDGRHILDMVNFTPSWIGEANYGLAADIEHKRILFPHRVKGDIDIIKEDDSLKTGRIFEPWDEIEEQINELCKITMTFTKTGIQHFDLPEIPSTQQTKISLVQRKDRYSALLLSTYAARTYINEGQMTFEPFVGGWVDYL